MKFRIFLVLCVASWVIPFGVYGAYAAWMLGSSTGFGKAMVGQWDELQESVQGVTPDTETPPTELPRPIWLTIAG